MHDDDDHARRYMILCGGRPAPPRRQRRMAAGDAQTTVQRQPATQVRRRNCGAAIAASQLRCRNFGADGWRQTMVAAGDAQKTPFVRQMNAPRGIDSDRLGSTRIDSDRLGCRVAPCAAREPPKEMPILRFIAAFGGLLRPVAAYCGLPT